MKLDYATLISPYPLYLYKLGRIKPPSLKEIWSSTVTYNTYKIYISLLSLSPKDYCENIDKSKLDWFNNLPESDKCNLSVLQLLPGNEKMIESYGSMFNFFFVERVVWNENNCLFMVMPEDVCFDTCTQKFYTTNKNNEKVETENFGLIHNGNFSELCDVILQLCGANKEDEDEKPKFKNKAAERIWLKTHNARVQKQNKADKYLELPNIISSYASYNHSSINMLNIWDLTVCQLYDQFQRERSNNYLDISKYQVGYCGDKDKKFDGDMWYKSIKIN